ncbi:protein FAR1-RELATED SEQUENCE 5-like [Primulina tabacum]|uniref:protein FAR1-RELATED SEQUENCE 5-like n=1 Tax=Primulina tabacum TaxID=48773 RepID=UPI003F5AC374
MVSYVERILMLVNKKSYSSSIDINISDAKEMEEISGDEQSYIPQVRDNQKPKIGMKFESLEDTFSFYNQYARESDEIRWSKQAKSEEPIKERARGEIRSGCKSKISVVKEQTSLGWVVNTFMESHNHPLSTPSKVYLLCSHQSGGPEHVGCTERDMRNYEKTLRDEHKGIDVETLIDFFQSEKDKSSTFFFDYETDSDNRFSRCFCVDPVSRRAYTVFGDVVVFDTTYNTNKYGMIFAPFV